MKKSKLFLLLLLALLMTVIVTACKSPDTTGENTASGTESSTPEETDPPFPTSFSSIKIGDREISDYTIVYAQSAYSDYVKNAQTRRLFPVYDFDKETADRLSDLIFSFSGVRLPVAEDVSHEKGEYEILVGKTNRTAISDTLKLTELESDDYTLTVFGSALALCGGEYGTTWHAVDYLEKLWSDALAAEKDAFVFGDDFSYKGSYHLTRIGCIGDSITEGVGSSNSPLYAYPAQLGRYLWKDAVVINYGNSGKTMRRDLADAFMRTNTYMSALRQAAKIDIFTIMLGTNDSNRDRDWTEEDSVLYNESCLALVEALKKKNSSLRFVLANCPAYFGNDDFGSETVRELQDALVPVLNDAGYPTTFFDMYAVTKSFRSLFPDSLHPNDEGHRRMAEAFAEELQELIASKA